MTATDRIKIDILKRHIMSEVELRGGFPNIRNCNQPADLYAIAQARGWLDGHCYAGQHGREAIEQLYNQAKQQAYYDDE